MELYKQIANDLLTIWAVQIKTNPKEYFTWTSGIKSPIYCDNRLTISYPEIRRRITDAFVKEIEDLSLQPDVIAGCATAGIPHASWLADRLGLPLVYVRSKPKQHGTGSQIEGKIMKRQKVIVIEDLISTGGSAIDATKVVQKEGNEVLQVLSILTYGLERAKENFNKAGSFYDTILNFDQLLKVLLQNQKMTSENQQNLLAWLQGL